MFSDDLLHAQVFWNIIDAEHPVRRLVPVVNAGFMVAQGNALEALGFHGALNLFTELSVFD